MPKKDRKAKLATLLIVGEGPIDKAFINHMKGLYGGQHTGQKVKVDSADGGSPADIIETTIRKYRHAHYDKRFILIDEDVPIRQQDYDSARKAKIELVVSKPICLEGMLLDVLEQDIPSTNAGCKASLHPQLSGSPRQPESYTDKFPKAVLDVTPKEQIVMLRKFIANAP